MSLSYIFTLGILTFLWIFVGTAQVQARMRSTKSHYTNATWYYPGLGACGVWNVNSDPTVALPPIDYAGGTKCGRQIKVSYKGKSVVVKVVDLCPTCEWGGIDLSLSAFQKLAPMDLGIMPVTWEYV